MHLWFYTSEADAVAVIRTDGKCWRNAECGTGELRPEQIDGHTPTWWATQYPPAPNRMEISRFRFFGPDLPSRRSREGLPQRTSACVICSCRFGGNAAEEKRRGRGRVSPAGEY